jgi:hypothetical protein
VRLDDEMHVIALHTEMRDGQAAAMRPRNAGANPAKDDLRAHVRPAGERAHRHMDRVIRVV